VAVVAYSDDALADLDRLEAFAPGAVELIASAVEVLQDHPLVGRGVEEDLRELLISRGKTGYVALYDYDELADTVITHAVRHGRELGHDSAP
jgi:plasmid stabilization system protein ParE